MMQDLLCAKASRKALHNARLIMRRLISRDVTAERTYYSHLSLARRSQFSTYQNMESPPKRQRIAPGHKSSDSTYTKWGVWDCPSIECQARMNGPRFLDEGLGTDPATCTRCNEDRYDIYWRLFSESLNEWETHGFDPAISMGILNERVDAAMHIPN
nr:MAG: hypothetical protein [Arizlama virus]